MSDLITIQIETDAIGDLVQLVSNGIEQERRRPKYGSAALTSGRRLARLSRLRTAIAEAGR